MSNEGLFNGKESENLESNESQPANIEAVADRESAKEWLFEVMISDIRAGRSEQDNGPHTEMRKALLAESSFDYDTLKSLADREDLLDDQKIEEARRQTEGVRESLWQGAAPAMVEWAGAINNLVDSRKTEINRSALDLEKLYGLKIAQPNLVIHLVPSFIKNEGSFAEPAKEAGHSVDFIPVGYPAKASDRILITALHETSHQQLQGEAFNETCEEAQRDSLYQEVKNICGDVYYNISREAVTNFLDTYIERKYFGRAKKDGRPNEINPYTFAEYVDTDLADEYLASGKKLMQSL